MIRYPEHYATLSEEEMEYLSSGFDAKGMFDYVVGNYFRDQLLSEARSAIWSSAKQGQIDPFEKWVWGITELPTVGKVVYAYGAFRLVETLLGYVPSVKNAITTFNSALKSKIKTKVKNTLTGIYDSVVTPTDETETAL